MNDFAARSDKCYRFRRLVGPNGDSTEREKNLGTHPLALCTPILAVQLPKVVVLATLGDNALNAETGQKLAYASTIRCAAVSNLQDVRRRSHFDTFICSMVICSSIFGIK